jgi:threonyl-tRNA synthetase
VHGKEDTLITIQIDIMLAQKFGMEYVDADGTRKTPYIIHRSSIGCYERTLALLLEKYAGALPAWLMPEQVRVLPITDRTADYADISPLNSHFVFRARPTASAKSVARSGRRKTPKSLNAIFGGKESENDQVSVRHRSGGDLAPFP